MNVRLTKGGCKVLDNGGGLVHELAAFCSKRWSQTLMATITEQIRECALNRVSPGIIHSYLYRSIIAFIDLLQSSFQALQFRLPLPLDPADGLRHPRFVSHPYSLAHQPPPRPRVLAQLSSATACGRGNGHRCPALLPRAMMW